MLGSILWGVFAAIWFPAVNAQAVTLYDGNLNTLPAEQGWLYGTDPPPPPFGAGVSVVQDVSGGATRLDTTPEITDSAGYFSNYPLINFQHPNNPILDRENGFTIRFGVQILSENHVSDDRAGFSVIFIASDGIGLELGFWEGEIWAQDHDPLFTHAEGTAFDAAAFLSGYSLAVRNNAYFLFAEDVFILSGALRDYSEFTHPTADVYEIPNFLFFGDDTSSAAADIKLAFIEVSDHLLGDLNGNGDVNLDDAILALRLMTGVDASDLDKPYILSGADVNGDWQVGLEEVAYILQDVSETR